MFPEDICVLSDEYEDKEGASEEQLVIYLTYRLNLQVHLVGGQFWENSKKDFIDMVKLDYGFQTEEIKL